ncbi:MAG: C25 family cysteine peptidase [Ignavibacteria bacterium]
MRKIFFTLIVCLSLIDNSFSQNNYNWITPNKTYLKLYVNENGIYRLNSTDFSNAGINPGTIDPRTVKVLYKGNQLPIFFQGEDDGTFDNNDFFDFYGERNYGGVTNYLNGFDDSFAYSVDDYYNLYSDTSVYWIDWGGSNGLRMSKSTYVSPVSISNENYFKRVHFEKNNFYYLGETRNPASDFRYFSNELVVGEGWFWKDLTTEQTLSDTTYINDLSTAPGLCSLHVFIKPQSYTDSVFNEHRIEIILNGTIVDTLIRNNLARFDTTITFPSSLLTNNATNNISLRYIPLGNQFFLPVIFIDFFDLYYPRDFGIRNNSLHVTLSGTDSTSKKISLSNYNPGNPINIYDILNSIRIENYSNSGNILTYTGKSNSSFQIINDAITKKPFRIKQRQVGDLVSNTNGADYLIIYNKLFESAVQQLRDHRESFDNFRSVKTEIEEIYDIFNYGIEDPVAVRNFVIHAYNTWQLPQLKYVCLFGRASLDPKKNSPGSQYYENFVPTYGNPPTDGYFVNVNVGTYTYYHQISVGRIPVYTPTEAQNVVNKLITYDIQPPDKWWKKYIAITGGGFRTEQINFQNKSNSLINNYIIPPPISQQVAKIYRNDSTGYITYNYKDSIKKEIDRGALLVNFIGHAAAQDWEIGLENPNTLNNGNRQPFIMSFTCYTGKCSEPNFRSFGENFFIIPNKCAIGFLGTTGWSFSGIGDNYNEQVIRNFSKDSVRRLGDLVSTATRKLAGDSNTFSTRNTINCYNLIGDPATKLLMPDQPEFEIKQTDIKLSNPFPAIGEIIKLSAFPKNLGTYVDTCQIKFQIRKNGAPSQRLDTIIRTFGYIDTIDYFFQIDTIGNYTVTIALDPNGKYSPQKFTNNDSITFPLTLRNLSYVPVKPLDNAVLNSNTFKFTGLNPNVDPIKNSIKVILQIDTARSFNSPALQMYNNNNISGVSTSFSVTVPVLEQNTLYYLRTNALVNNDSSGWSAIQRVIYNPDISTNKENVTDSTYTIYRIKPGQYEESDLYNVNYTPEGFRLNNFTGTFYVKSYGSNGDQASYFLINDISFYSDGGSNTGLNIARVRKFNGLIREIRNFRMNSPQSSDSVLNFLNSFDSTDYLLSYISSYVPGGDSLRADAKAKFREFGSVYVDSIDINFFDTWSMIGSLGSLICEDAHPYVSDQIPSVCQLNPEFQHSTGRISQTVGTADRWNSFSWAQTLPPGASVSFDVVGIDRDNVPVILGTNLTNNSFVNIDTINYYTYPNLRLDANLKIDSAKGFDSPVFTSTNVKYIPPAELIPDNNSISSKDTLVQEGDSVRVSINYYNVGYIDAASHINKWYLKDNKGDIILKTDTITTPLKIDSMSTSQIVFSTTGRRNPKLEIDTIDLYFETTLAGNRNELFSYNNVAITQFIVQGDTVQPLMEVTYDGINILNGDFIQSKPDITLKFFDDSRMVINDTSNIKVYNYVGNGFTYVPYFINGIKNPEIDISFPDTRFLQATVTYKPTLTAGEHKFRYVATDITGNFADSIVNNVIVDDNLRIHDIANYPNPIRTETNFMFNLSGEFNPTSCKVKIYTVAGRLVREINTPANVGYNSIFWDGKDNDGDFIANGVYLYKFIIQGDSQIETSIQKLAVLR